MDVTFALTSAEMVANGGSGVAVEQLTLAAGAVTDVAGNAILASSTPDATYDIGAPYVTAWSGVPSRPINSNSLLLSLTFSETVNGLAPSSFSCGAGCSVTSVSGSGSSYSIVVSFSQERSTSVMLLAGAVTDNAGNGNDASSSPSFVYDITPPAATFSNLPSAPTNSPTIAGIVLSFAEPLDANAAAALAPSDFTCGSGCSVSLVALQADGTFVLTLSMSLQNAIADSTHTITILANSVKDLAGNGNLQSTSSQSFLFDSTPPTVTSFAGVPSKATAIASHTITVTFSESVFSPNVGAITCGSGCAVSGLTVLSSTSLSVVVTFSAETSFVLTVGSGAVVDQAGNANVAASSPSMRYDITPPSATISAIAANGFGETNVAAQVVTVTFSEPVFGVSTSAFACGAGCTVTAAAAVGDSQTTFSVDLSFSSDGPKTLTLTANAVTDEAGNGNLAQSSNTVVFDSTPPTVTQLSGLPTGFTNAKQFTISLVFSEVVVGLSAAGLSCCAGQSYSFVVTLTTDGSYTVSVAAGAATDKAGNGNAAASSNTVVLDTVPLTMAIEGLPSHATNTATFSNLKLVFSKPVVGVASAGMLVCSSGCSLGSVTPDSGSSLIASTSFSFSATFSSDGIKTFDFAGGQVADHAGNVNLDGSATAVYDTTPPHVTIEGWPSGSTYLTTVSLTLVFSEPVSGLSVSGMSCGSSCTVSSPSEVNGNSSVYAVSVTFAATGTYSFAVSSGSASDEAGNLNIGATTAAVFYQNTPIAASFSSFPTGYTNVAVRTVGVAFNRAVSGLSLASFSCSSGCTVSNLQTTSSSLYSVDLPFTSDGPKQLTLLANTVTDAAQLSNPQPSQTSTVIFDSTPPTIASLVSDQTSPTNVSLVHYTLTFSEPVLHFDASSVSLDNATNGFAVQLVTSNNNGDVYAIVVSLGSTDGPKSLSINTGTGITDLAGNALTGSAAASTMVLDTTPPRAHLALSSSVSNSRNFTVSILLSEPVTLLTSSDLIVVNAVVTSIAPAASTALTSQSVVGAGQQLYSNWTVFLEAISKGQISVTLRSHFTGTDAAGNSIQLTIDSNVPTSQVVSFACAQYYFGPFCGCNIPVYATTTEYPDRLASASSSFRADVLTLSFTESLKFDPTQTQAVFSTSCAALTNMSQWSYVEVEGNGDPATSCYRQWTISAPWSAVYQPLDGGANHTCGLSPVTSTSTGLVTKYDAVFSARGTETYYSLRNQPIARVVENAMPFQIAFQDTVSFDSSTVLVFADVITSAAIVQQTVWRNVSASTSALATIKLFTAVQSPFYLKPTSAVLTPMKRASGPI